MKSRKKTKEDKKTNTFTCLDYFGLKQQVINISHISECDTTQVLFSDSEQHIFGW